MIKRITKQDVADVREIKLDDIISLKGTKVVSEVINDALRMNKKIVCIGGQASGKTLLMRVLINKRCDFDEDSTCDDATTAEDYNFIASNKCKYATCYAKSTEDFLEAIKQRTGRDTIGNCVVITRKIDTDTHSKIITNIDEIVEYDGVNVINNIVDIHKDKYRKLSDLEA